MQKKPLGKPRAYKPHRGEHAMRKDVPKPAVKKPLSKPVQHTGAFPQLEIVPAILRTTFEKIEEDWEKVKQVAGHIQIDITDGVFAGDGTFRDVPRFKRLSQSDKSELHFMVHTPANFVDGVIDLNPARCIFHLESFSGSNDLRFMYHTLRAKTNSQLALALNPESPNERLDEFLDLIDFVLFMGYNPGWANQPINPLVYKKVMAFYAQHPEIPIAADGHVSKETIPYYVKAGARILCANTAIFSMGDAVENYRQLELLARAALT
jgi:pentose-5-phosphate-3-epimerase